jgi:hypothetical protein
MQSCLVHRISLKNPHTTYSNPLLDPLAFSADIWLIPQYLDRTSPLWDSKRTQNDSAGIAIMQRYCSAEETYKAVTQTTDPYLALGLSNPTVVSWTFSGPLFSPYLL